jgi:hypothetical protein
MAPRELLQICSRNLDEGDTESVRRNREAPERITQLFDESLAIGFASLKNLLSNKAEDLPGLFGESGGGV